jgi:hypothetical protein
VTDEPLDARIRESKRELCWRVVPRRYAKIPQEARGNAEAVNLTHGVVRNGAACAQHRLQNYRVFVEDVESRYDMLPGSSPIPPAEEVLGLPPMMFLQDPLVRDLGCVSECQFTETMSKLRIVADLQNKLAGDVEVRGIALKLLNAEELSSIIQQAVNDVGNASWRLGLCGDADQGLPSKGVEAIEAELLGTPRILSHLLPYALSCRLKAGTHAPPAVVVEYEGEAIDEQPPLQRSDVVSQAETLNL